MNSNLSAWWLLKYVLWAQYSVCLRCHGCTGDREQSFGAHTGGPRASLCDGNAFYAVPQMRACLAVSLLGEMLVGGGTAVDPELLSSLHLAPSEGDATITKTVVSSRLRLIFFVGLEGSGHHFMRETFEDIFEDHDLEQIDECNIGPNIYMPSAMRGSASDYKNKQDSLRREMQRLAAIEKDIEDPGTVVTVQRTNPAQGRRCGKGPEYSYPNGFGPDKALAYADFQLLARLAEEEGVDFRILYLNRSAKDVLLSDISHRHFHE